MEDLKSKAIEISQLIDNLILTEKNLDQLERSVFSREDIDEEKAEQILNESVKKAEQVYKLIGQRLNFLGGLEVMQYAIYQVPYTHAVISSSWDGIGEWHH